MTRISLEMHPLRNTFLGVVHTECFAPTLFDQEREHASPAT